MVTEKQKKMPVITHRNPSGKSHYFFLLNFTNNAVNPAQVFITFNTIALDLVVRQN